MLLLPAAFIIFWLDKHCSQMSPCHFGAMLKNNRMHQDSKNTKVAINSSPKSSVAIIGGGISGLSCAYHLNDDFDVTVYESAAKPGGHTDTHEFELEGKLPRVDSGFIIFCPQYYPNFTAMLDDLGVESQPTNMSFSARNHLTGTIYNASNPNKLFCDRRNLLRPSFWRMVFDIVRFYRSAKSLLTDKPDITTSVSEYLLQNNYSKQFSEDHLLPMVSALWSATPEKVKEFPIHHLIDFFDRHGLMKFIGRPQWLVVKNGSASYVEALQAKLNCTWKLNEPVQKITRESNSVQIVTKSGANNYDAVVMATHADISLAIIQDASASENEILSDILFEDNQVIMHTDESLMHPNKKSWASWNTVVPRESDQNSLNCCTANYWMNSLQSLDLTTNVFTTLNSTQSIDPDKVLAKRSYSHPIFTAKSVAAQKRLPEINGKKNTFHAGAFWGWGFHEDGARSAAHACKLIQDKFVNHIQTKESQVKENQAKESQVN